MAAKKNKCVRCEALERSQKSKEIHYILGAPLCSVCVEEIHDEPMFTSKEEDDVETTGGIEDFA